MCVQIVTDNTTSRDFLPHNVQIDQGPVLRPTSGVLQGALLQGQFFYQRYIRFMAVSPLDDV